MKKGIKYILKFLGWFILGIIVLLLLVALLIQTSPVKNKIASIAENQAAKFLNGNLTIGRIDGNFFSSLSLEDVLLTYENDTVAYIKELAANYNIWSLVNGTVEVQSAAVNEPYFFLEQYPDSTWNFEQLVKPAPETTDTTTSGGIDVILKNFKIIDGNIKINALDTVIPQRVQNLNTSLSFRMSGDRQTAELKSFTLSTIKPDFNLEQLQLSFLRDSDYVELNDFLLKTNENQLTGSANFETEPYKKGSAHFETTALQLSEFEYFIPDFKLPAKPIVKLDASLDKDSAYVDIDLKDQNQQILVDASFGNLVKYLTGDSTVMLSYDVNGKLDNIELAHWFGDPEMDYFINGKLNARGAGIEPADAALSLKADFSETVVEDKRFKEIVANIDLDRGNLSGFIRGNGEFGAFTLDPDIQNLLEHPVYRIDLTTEDLNLAVLLGNDSLSSDLNLSATIRGKEFDPDKLSARAGIVFSNSRFQDIQLDTLFANVGYRNENIQIDSLWMKTDSITLTAKGNYSLNSNSDIRLNANVEGISAFESYLPVSGLKTSGKLQAHLYGTADSLHLESTVNLNETQFQDLKLSELQLNANGQMTKTDTLFDAHVVAYDFVSGDFQLDSIAAQVNGSLDSLFLNAQVANKDLNTKIKTGVVPGDKLRLTIANWQIDYKNQQWALQQAPAVIEIDSANYNIQNFRLASEGTDSMQYIFAEGKITRQGQEDFTLEIANISLSNLGELLELNTEVTGKLDINMKVSGTATAPKVAADFGLDGATLNNYAFTEFNGNFNYENEQLSADALLIPQDSGKFELNAQIPLQLNLDTMGYTFNENAPLDAHLSINDFSLAVLQTFNITGDIKGFLEGDINVSGTVKEPDPSGNLKLVDASLAIDEYGIEYNQIELNVDFLRDKIKLDTLLIRTEDGYLIGSGQVDFESAFYEGKISKSQISFDLDKFNPVNHPQFNMQVSGNASLGGEKDHVVYDGDLKIPQAEIYLPAVLGMMGKMNAPEIPKPILMQELEKMSVSMDTLDIQTFEPVTPDSVQFTYFNNLEGNLRIRIPKNTWIKNEDMRIEISGELELRKSNEFFELFGTVNVVRGQYDLLGKTFVINQGTINFQGGEEMMPQLNINASYTFRNAQRAEQELTVDISGTAEQPEVSFKLDGSEISEGDALSYILFGKGMNELTLSQQDNVSSSGGGSLAEKAAASVLSSQLTNFLSDKLNVDYIEVKSEGGFDNATVVVGKYITNDLFVSYEQRFGEVNEKDMAKYEVKLEYELFRFLFFELNNSSNDSGFDVIFKFDVK